jgi:hypothetical protein
MSPRRASSCRRRAPGFAPVGRAAQLNNRQVHEVASRWDRCRTHLIFDVLADGARAPRFVQAASHDEMHDVLRSPPALRDPTRWPGGGGGA